MEKTDKIPWWVFLAFSSIDTRKGALVLIRVCAVFSIYCIPWLQFFENQQWVAKIFLIEDWSWFGMMIPITTWYLISLKWVDRHQGWDGSGQDKDIEKE
jgi:hypothetical protein